MYSVYRLRANELDERFLEALKMLFVDKVIEITVNEVGGPANGAVRGAKAEQDETTYLFQASANRQHLLEAIEYINSGRPLRVSPGRY